jgi:hypothetical protein
MKGLNFFVVAHIINKSTRSKKTLKNQYQEKKFLNKI